MSKTHTHIFFFTEEDMCEEDMNDHHPISILDALYCEEQSWEKVEEEEEDGHHNEDENLYSSFLPGMSEEDLQREDEKLLSLSAKEEESKQQQSFFSSDPFLCSARKEAVEWMLKVVGHYSFTALTVVLAVNYLDRFLASLHFQRDKPWMAQLAAVACLSLAAKVEETQVPLLLDLQVEKTKYVFEARTVQRMELLVLSTLGWRMNPVTPLSFIEHIVRKLGLKSRLHWDFFKRCERLLVSAIADSRLVGQLPSIVAAATMLHVINELEPWNAFEYENQLLNLLGISKDRVEVCLHVILELASLTGQKRKHLCLGLFDMVSPTTNEPLIKKSRSDREVQQIASSMNKVFVLDVLSSP